MGDPGGGTVPESAVVGRAFVIIWPPSRWRILPIPATFEQPQLSASSAAGSAAADGPLSARLEPAGPALPLSFGFAAAIPVTWLQRRVRLRVARRRADRPIGGPTYAFNITAVYTDPDRLSPATARTGVPCGVSCRAILVRCPPTA